MVKRKYEGPKSGWYIYGNWWGPNWSAGSYGDSRDYERLSKYPKPIDYNDESAMFHDQQYAIANRTGDTAFSSKRKRDADFQFAKRGFTSGTVLGTVGALAVGAQGVARTIVGAVQRKRPVPRLKAPIPSSENKLNMVEIEMKPAAARQLFKPRKKSKGEGKYGGKIDFPRKKPKISKNIFAMKGSRGEIEGTFQSEASHVNAVGFTSMIRSPLATGSAIGSATYQLAAAMLRTILKRVGIHIEHHNQSLGAIDFVSEHGAGPTEVKRIANIRFWYAEYDVPTGSTTGTTTHGIGYELDMAPTLTFQTCARLMAQKVICGSEFGARGSPGNLSGSNRVRELYGYQITYRDWTDSGAANYVTAKDAIVRLTNQCCIVESYTRINLQNATLSDGDSKSTDVIDTNPIKGKIYYFSHPNPVLKHVIGASEPYDKLMYDQNYDGVLWPNAEISTSGGYNPFNQLPPPDIFMNCKRYDNVMLHPGQIKSFDLKFKFEGKIVDFIKNLKLLQNTDDLAFAIDVTKDSKALGTCVLFAFDKLLNTGSSKCTINWERTVKTQAVLTKNKNVTLLPAATVEQTLVQDDLTV